MLDDCALRALVFNRSRTLLDIRRLTKVDLVSRERELRAVADALRLSECRMHRSCASSEVGTRRTPAAQESAAACDLADAARLRVHVSPVQSPSRSPSAAAGSDDVTGDGTLLAPFTSLTAARDALRQRRAQMAPNEVADVVLLPGVHELARPLNLDARDSHTRFVACSRSSGWSRAARACG